MSGNIDLSHTLHGLVITEISIYYTDKSLHVKVYGGWKPKILRNRLSESLKRPRDPGFRHSRNDKMAVEELL